MTNPRYQFIYLSNGLRAQAVALVDGDGNQITALGGNISSRTFIKDLINGANTITHNLGKDIEIYSVKDSGAFVAVEGENVDTNNFKITLSGGGITDAEIILAYNV